MQQSNFNKPDDFIELIEIPPKDTWKTDYLPSELLLAGALLSDIQHEFRLQPDELMRSTYMDYALPTRAARELDSINLSAFENELPLVKQIATKLYLIRNELHRRAGVSLKLVVSITSVSPSQCPTESPSHPRMFDGA